MVKKTNIFPKNKEHFKKLLPFAKKILLILKENKINFVIYSSYATFFHTKDESLRVHDIDILIKEKDYPKVMQALEKSKFKFKFMPEWDTLEIKKEKLKIDIDRMGKGCKGIKQGSLPKKTVSADFYGIPVKLVTIQDLYDTYYRGYKLVPEEKVKLGKKVQYLKKFMSKK
ncbi:hypothetical protein KAI32_00095 [Candidatus Pacearchaeota archaeon]|nr:hypothetical protein [Candidatus Pacearchaeota archaeon]